MENSNCSQCFSTGQSTQERGFAHVQESYEVPPSERPSLTSPYAEVPVIDLVGLRAGPSKHSAVIESVWQACQRFGFFQVNLVTFKFLE